MSTARWARATGIGLEIAREFVALGARVMVVSRSVTDVARVVAELNATRLPPLPPPSATAAEEEGAAARKDAVAFGCAADVSTLEGRATLVASVHALWGGSVDLLVRLLASCLNERALS